MADQQPFYGTSHVAGSASAKLLAAGVELSFWGGVDPRTGEVIDRFHPLSGCFLKDTILAIPGSRGSCGGSVVMMELMLNGQGPKALIFERPEEIITLGVMVAEEMFDETAAVVTLDPKDFRQLLKRNGELVHVRGREVSTTILETQIIKSPTASATTINESSIHLTDDDCAILSGEDGEAAKVALRIIIRMSKMMDAQELMSVSQAHADSAWYGPGSVAFGKRLRDYGGKFKVPTTINAINVDQKRWRALGVNSTFGVACDELAQAYLEMGGTMSFTCAPYLLDTVPKLGDMIAWGESNAVIYANSVLGARSLKNPNMLEALIALTGRAPKAGVYLDENRLASIWLKICPPAEVDDSFWPILGFAVGAVAMARIPVISGLESFKPSKDDFKAFSAAFATSSSAPMFHMVNLTPEAPTLGVVFSERTCPEAILLNGNDLFAIWDEFNHGCEPRKIDLISLGNPHFSAKEMKKLLSLCQGRVKKDDVALIITCGRAQYSLASQAGYVRALEDFGVQFLQDTCWCSIEEPIIPFDAKTIMTNSGKYIHYGPGLTGRQFAFGNLAMCVDAACSGKTSGEPPLWLLQTKSDVA